MYTPSEAERAAFRNVWVIAEMLDNRVQSVTHELLGAARRLADTRGSEVCCVVMGNGVPEAKALADLVIGRHDEDGLATWVEVGCPLPARPSGGGEP